MRRTILAAVVVYAVSAAGQLQAQSPAPTPAAAPTFSKDVAPVFYKNCTSCHRPGEIGPMALVTYQDARPWARSIAAKMASGARPPWHADPANGEFVNDRRLSSTDKETILKWIAAGAPEGNPADLPAAPTYADGWQVGLPDLPAVGVRRRRREIGRIAFGRAGGYPFQDGLFVGTAQAPIVDELTIGRISVPGRPRARGHLRRDRSRPRPGVLIGDEHHRADFAGTVTARAVLVKDRGHVLAERWRGGRCRRRRLSLELSGCADRVDHYRGKNRSSHGVRGLLC